MPPLEARRLTLQRCPAESFKIVGVSFEGRQEAIAALQAGVLPFAVLLVNSLMWQEAVSVSLPAASPLHSDRPEA